MHTRKIVIDYQVTIERFTLEKGNWIVNMNNMTRTYIIVNYTLDDGISNMLATL